ncbi:MAG TPA: DUF4382 domain-containing protein [Candidatus Binatia bacterium]
MKSTVSFVCCNLIIGLCLLALPALATERDQGVLEIRIKDHREAIDDFANLNITVDKISISPQPGLMFWQTGWKDLTPSIAAIDLTQYTGKNTARVFRSDLDSGSFDAFHLKVKTIAALLKKTRRAVPVKNTIGPLKLSFQVPAHGETLLVLDLVVTDFSDHPPRGYELGIKGYELFTNGKSIQKVPPG